MKSESNRYRYVKPTLLDGEKYTWAIRIDDHGLLVAWLDFRPDEYFAPEAVLSVSASEPESLEDEMLRAERNLHYAQTGEVK